MTLTKDMLYQIFWECNEKYFNGALPEPNLALHSSFTVPGRYDYTVNRYGEIVRDCISISKSFDWDEEHLIDVVLHEMIHENVYEYGKDTGDGPHGKAFQDVMNTINARYGRHITIDQDLDKMKPAKWSNRLAWWFANQRAKRR